jgi:hypothetical protein
VRKSQDKVNKIKVKVDLFNPNSKSDSYILNILTSGVSWSFFKKNSKEKNCFTSEKFREAQFPLLLIFFYITYPFNHHNSFHPQNHSHKNTHHTSKIEIFLHKIRSLKCVASVRRRKNNRIINRCNTKIVHNNFD